MRLRRLEMADMAEMQKVEYAMRQHHAALFGPRRCADRAQLVDRFDARARADIVGNANWRVRLESVESADGD